MSLALLSLIASGFLSATLLPGSSEVALLAYLRYFPETWLLAILCVGVANTAGSLSSYWLARFISSKKSTHKSLSEQSLARIRRYGSPALFFSFVPLIGDALPFAAGWLKLPLGRCIFFIALGKFTRYALLILGNSYIN
jgi:membrane protein YqaA with SNARE-associated domain